MEKIREMELLAVFIALFVIWLLAENKSIHHRGTEDTEEGQKIRTAGK